MSALMQASPLQRIDSRLFAGYSLWIKRDDLLHPIVSGNKYRKLKYALPKEHNKEATTIISMGGPWSNHLHALAYACREASLKSIGFVRGYRNENAPLTACLKDCVENGMQLHFVSREEYRLLREHPDYWQKFIPQESAQVQWLAEGGRSVEALRGVTELVDEIHQQLGRAADVIVCPCGSGTTMAGIVIGMNGRGRAIGISAVQNGHFLSSTISDIVHQSGSVLHHNFDILHEFDHGGFAKTSPQLIDFCHRFTEETRIPIEPIYTGKMLFAVAELCNQKYFTDTDNIVLLHTGGLQGNRGFSSQL
jgi:1-aminocyclopropane-1-carboxylate deaminase